MRADGSGETIVTNSPATDVDPDWQPLDDDDDDDEDYDDDRVIAPGPAATPV